MAAKSTKPRKFPALPAVMGLAIAASALAGNRQDLTEACEVAIARSALPQRLRADASVYALKGDKYEKVITGSGPFTCIIERNHRDSVAPQCMDAAGIDSTLPAIIHRSLMSVSGADFQQINETHHQNIEKGDYQPASRPGISYMMSDYNYTFVESAKREMKIPPHVMFYAPYIKNEDIGGSFQSMTENIGTPFVFNEGMHGYMIVYTQFRADPNEVAEECRGQLGEPPPSFDPFRKG
jgi:hypothetical protein